MVKTISTLAIVSVLAVPAAAPVRAEPTAAPICLSTRNIVDTSPEKDGRSITFRMKDGSVWRNVLRGRCPDLRWNGFSWTTSDPMEEICENEQTLRVFRSGEVCGLGKFIQVIMPDLRGIQSSSAK